MFFVGMGGAQAFTRLLKLPEGILMAGVLIMSLVGSFAVRGNPLDVVVAILAGFVGVLLRLIGIPMAPIVIGMALGITFEESFRQGMMLSDGNFTAFFQQPIAFFIFLLTALIVFWPLLSQLVKNRRRQSVEDATSGDQ